MAQEFKMMFGDFVQCLAAHLVISRPGQWGEWLLTSKHWLLHSWPTCEWSVGDRGVIKEPCRLDAVHHPTLDAQCHPTLLTDNHSRRQDDPRHIERLLFLWVGGDRTEIKASVRERGGAGGCCAITAGIAVDTILKACIPRNLPDRVLL